MIENPVELPEKSGDASHIQILREQDGTRDAVIASMDPFRRRIAGEALQKLQCVKIVPMLAEPSVSKQTYAFRRGDFASDQEPLEKREVASNSIGAGAARRPAPGAFQGPAIWAPDTVSAALVTMLLERRMWL
jgi:hypothetical protein